MKTLDEHRIVFLRDAVTNESASELVAKLLLLDAQSSDEITLLIQSPGGSVYDGWALVDTIRSLRSKVKTVAVGLAASMGATILLAGDTRVALPHSAIMIHQASGGSSGSFKDVETTHKEFKRVNDQLKAFIKERSKITDEQIEKFFDRDTWLTAEQALELGVITEIEQRVK